MTPEEVAWLAGLIEGEGCISVHSSTTVPRRWYLRIAMTDVDVVERARQLTGVGTVRLNRRPGALSHWKTQAHWNVEQREDLLVVLRQVRPWLGARRGARADEAIADIEATPRLRARRSPRIATP